MLYRKALTKTPSVAPTFVGAREAERKSEMGSKPEELKCEQMFSALPLIVDIAQRSRHVRFVPQKAKYLTQRPISALIRTSEVASGSTATSAQASPVRRIWIAR